MVIIYGKGKRRKGLTSSLDSSLHMKFGKIGTHFQSLTE